MATLIPTASSCHNLQLPPTERDDRLNLNVRTGSASTLYNSFVFTYGGLTIGLELPLRTHISSIIEVFQSKITNAKTKRLNKYLSGELFYLNLIERQWHRVDADVNAPRPRARVFHEISAVNNCVYVFGGLVLGDDLDTDVLVPANDLWQFDLATGKWLLLHDGKGWDTDLAVPAPRYNFKLLPISSIPFDKKDHFGLFIAGGQLSDGTPVYQNAVFDLVAKRWVKQPIDLPVTTGDPNDDAALGLDNCLNLNQDRNISINYSDSILINYISDADHHILAENTGLRREHQESIIVYAPTKEGVSQNPLLSFKLSKTIKHAKVLPLHRKKHSQTQLVLRQTVPFNLKYPTGGLFGQNIVITGFLPNDFDISIFIYNKPTAKWSRLNIFCNHDYGSHRFWGGFAWQSHHKVVLIGNYVTSRTTSSVRFFSSMITVSLPITNILASSELAGGNLDFKASASVSDSDSSSERLLEVALTLLSPDINSDDEELKSPRRISHTSQSTADKLNNPISFSEYVDYAAPKTNFTKIRSVFPPAAITLGRNAFDRFGDLISDFEFVSAEGDRIPVSLIILMERWGKFFIDLLAKGYVKAVDKFENDHLDSEEHHLVSSYQHKIQNQFHHSVASLMKLKSSVSTGGSISSNSDSQEKHSYQLTIPMPAKAQPKEAPQFRLPFQENKDADDGTKVPPAVAAATTAMAGTPPATIAAASSSGDDPSRKNSTSSYALSSSLLTSHLQDLPPQLPLPNEPIPALPPASVSFRSTSRRSSQDLGSPRASLIHTLTALRNIPVNRSPKDLPFASPRTSMSAQSSSPSGNADLVSSPVPNLRPDHTSGSSENLRDSASNSSSENLVDKPNKKVPSLTSMTSVESGYTMDRKTPSSNSSNSVQEPHHEENENRLFNNALLNFENVDGKFKMEPSLIPRKLYMPFSTSTLKAFAEYLYTGQVGNKWLLTPATLDNLTIAKFFRVPLLYDLISEVLFGIIGRKEAHVIYLGNRLKKKYYNLMRLTNTPVDPNFQFPLDEYEGFMDTVDDGYLDLALLKKSSNLYKQGSVCSSRKKKSVVSNSSAVSGESRRASTTDDYEEAYHDAEAKKEVTEKIGEQPTKNDSTDDSDKKTTSNSEEDNDFELAFLDVHEKPSAVGPRSKSVFDRTRGQDAWAFEDEATDDKDDKERVGMLSLEYLVSPSSPPPSDHIIDLIYETGALITDMKLMLRAANARQMSRILAQTTIEFGSIIDGLKERYEQQQKEEKAPADEEAEEEVHDVFTDAESDHPSQVSTPINQVNSPSSMQGHHHPSANASISLPQTRVTSSPHFGEVYLSGSAKAKSVSDGIDVDFDEAASHFSQESYDPRLVPSSILERTESVDEGIELRTSPSTTSIMSKSKPFRNAIGGFTPFKSSKTESRLSSYEKRSSKPIRREEFLQEAKLARSGGEGRPGMSRSSSRIFTEHTLDQGSPSPSSSLLDKKLTSPTPHLQYYNFFRHLGTKKKRDTSDESLIDSSLRRTKSSVSVSLLGSGGSRNKKKHGLFTKKHI